MSNLNPVLKLVLSGVVFDNNEVIVVKYRKLHFSKHYNYRTFNKFIDFKKEIL